MCGFTGFVASDGFNRDIANQTVEAMSAQLEHRGPDDHGVWLDEVAGIAIGHRRLAVLDLSSAGHQPMLSASGRYVIAYNGELYNHLDMRGEVERSGYNEVWRGSSDTETLLAGIECWGLERTLAESTGMFAFALWDRRDQELILVRDRIGEKPLYYGWQGNTFLFGSELKSFYPHPEFNANIDRDVLVRYFENGFIPCPHSMYKGISKLRPGSVLRLSGRASPGTEPLLQEYWSLDAAIRGARANPFIGSDDDAVGELRQRLERAVSMQSVADVPLGAFLSGGIDSSTIVALLQMQSTQNIKTFTIGFEEGAYQEAGFAREIARHLGTDHTEFTVNPRDAMAAIPTLAELFDEPFGDSSAIPTSLVAGLARQHVTVSLSGDGGDELFGGYSRYHRCHEIWQRTRRVPRPVAAALSQSLGKTQRFFGSVGQRRKIERYSRYLAAGNCAELYHAQMLQRLDANALVLGSKHESGMLEGLVEFADTNACFDTMMFADTQRYLPDDILVKVDRATMGVSLESRVPMLDHRVVEFAWALPAQMKVRNLEGKWLLKRLARELLPATLIDRPKMGFGIPISEWSRGPLRDWAESLLSETALQQDGYLNPKLVREQWLQHVDKPSTAGNEVWQVLAFQAWLQTHKPISSAGVSLGSNAAA